MKKRILLMIITAMMVVSLFSNTALAAASASVRVNRSTIEVGSTVTVTVTFSATNIGAVQASFTYDDDILQYVSGNNTSGGSGSGKIVLYASAAGSSSLKTSMTFKSRKVGKAKVSVSASQILAYDETDLGTAGGSTSVTVKEKGTVTTTKASVTATPTLTPTFNPVEQGIQTTVGTQTLYVWTNITGITLPEGFAAAQATYGGKEIQVAHSATMTLAYLSDAKGENAVFYILDRPSGNLYPYLRVAADQVYTILRPDASVIIPDGYAETTLTIKDQTVQAWALTPNVTPEFYLIYAVNAKGTAGFYVYDTLEATIQRYVVKPVAVEEEPTPTPTPTPVAEATIQATLGFKDVQSNLSDKEVLVISMKKADFLQELQADPMLMAVFATLTGLVVIAAAAAIVLIMKMRRKPTKH